MKGIICAGGTGSRLAPLTKIDNKHLLPVYDKRMIEYPIRALVNAGVEDIILVTGGLRPGAFLEYLKNGEAFGIKHLYYTYQEGNGGIPDAIRLAEPFMNIGEKCVVMLGDNYFEEGISDFVNQHHDLYGAACLLRTTDTPWYFGIAEVQDDRIVSIEEKPSRPLSDLAILGCYIFDDEIWSLIDGLKPSDRGELEIVDILRSYMECGSLRFSTYNGFWSDMGTFETWSMVSQRVAK